MTISAGDQIGGVPVDLARAKSDAWKMLVATIDLGDAFTTNGSHVTHTWDNQQVDCLTDLNSHRVLKRLDCFYLLADLAALYPVAPRLLTHRYYLGTPSTTTYPCNSCFKKLKLTDVASSMYLPSIFQTNSCKGRYVSAPRELQKLCNSGR